MEWGRGQLGARPLHRLPGFRVVGGHEPCSGGACVLAVSHLLASLLRDGPSRGQDPRYSPGPLRRVPGAGRIPPGDSGLPQNRRCVGVVARTSFVAEEDEPGGGRGFGQGAATSS